MNVLELRIGNFIYINEKYPIKKVEGIYWNNPYEKYNVRTDIGLDYHDEIKPILLTHEWLMKFGFVRDKTDNYWYNTFKKFYPIYQRGKYYGFNGLGPSVKEFEYVHQLQNLYFSLTAYELVISS